MATYTVKKNDCLWNIAKEQLGDPLKWTYLADINGISRDYPLIHPGQVIKLDETDTGGGTAPDPPKSTASKVPKIEYFGLQAGTDRTLFATWTWSRSNTDNYQVIWYYDTGNSVWFIGNDSTTEDKQSVYSAPSNALRAKCKVKAIAKTHKVNDKDVAYWTCGWSSEKIYDFSNNPPAQPSAPTVKIDGFRLTASLDDIDDDNTKRIQFQVVKDNKDIFAAGTANVSTGAAAYSCNVEAGGSYKVRCRGGRDKNVYGDWSEYSGSVETIPATPAKIRTCRANSETSVYLEWDSVDTAESYEIEYATEADNFDVTDDTTSVTDVGQPYFEVTGLETGDEYFFRVRAVNEQGESGWSEVASTVIGVKPAAPTTWSSTTTAIVGEPLVLYWVHNSEDGSKQTYAEVEVTADGKKHTETIRPDGEEGDDEEEQTYSHPVDTSIYKEGSKIEWRVRTAGVTKQYGKWSIMRTVDIYAPPTLALSMKDINGNPVEVLTAFPFSVSALPGPNTQLPIGYSLSIIANESYETIDTVGNFKAVNQGTQVYAKYFDINRALEVQLTAGDIDLENNIEYTLTCTASMDSGLTAEQSIIFTVAWTETEYIPNAEVTYDASTYSAYIRPYCEDDEGNLTDNVLMAVYRREYDGSFVKLAEGIENNRITFVTDPHPALDYARYRIVGIAKDTGAVSYYDLPGYPVSEKAVIIQWDEFWSNFDTDNEDAIKQPPWSGSLLRLPYNIDVSDSNDTDAELVEYIGRKYPVAYYGTQLGTKATWNVEILKSDKETLYGLRRLAIWAGDAYVREPSGSGYWANVSVSFSKKHRELTIPVTLTLVRVEGGV